MKTIKYTLKTLIDSTSLDEAIIFAHSIDEVVEMINNSAIAEPEEIIVAYIKKFVDFDTPITKWEDAIDYNLEYLKECGAKFDYNKVWDALYDAFVNETLFNALEELGC